MQDLVNLLQWMEWTLILMKCNLHLQVQTYLMEAWRTLLLDHLPVWKICYHSLSPVIQPQNTWIANLTTHMPYYLTHLIHSDQGNTRAHLPPLSSWVYWYTGRNHQDNQHIPLISCILPFDASHCSGDYGLSMDNSSALFTASKKSLKPLYAASGQVPMICRWSSWQPPERIWRTIAIYVPTMLLWTSITSLQTCCFKFKRNHVNQVWQWHQWHSSVCPTPHLLSIYWA